MKIYVVVPVYNEASHIPSFLKELSKYRLHVVVVDDGSSDGSTRKAKGLRFSNLTVLEHKVNLGKGASMKTGADFAFKKGAEAVIFMDSDNQHKPSDLPKFIKALESNKYDAVFGSRNLSLGVPLIRFLGNKFASLLIGSMFNILISDVLCGFKAFTKEAYEKIKWESSGYGVEVELTARAGRERLKYMEVPVETVYHDKVKGVTILDAFGVLGEVIKWRFTI